MGRRKKTYMDDGSDSSDEEGGRISFDITDRDLEDEMAGFSGAPQRKKRMVDEALGDDDEDDDIPRGGLGSGFTASSFTQFQTSRTASTENTPSPRPTTTTTGTTDSPTPKPRRAPKPAADFAKFNAHSTGFGKKMLEKMGWKMGQGLGQSGEGIVNPIETKQRPKAMGIGFRGFDERTAQHKEEQRLRGQDVSSESEEEEEQVQKRNAWKQKKEPAPGGAPAGRVRKVKPKYKLATDIIADIEMQEAAAPLPAQPQKIVDMTGQVAREISMAEIHQTPTWIETTTRLPELRHNLQLIVDLSRGDLENLAREKNVNAARMHTFEDERTAVRRRIATDKERVARLAQVKTLGAELQQMSKNALGTGAYNQGSITALFGSVFDKFEQHFKEEITTLRLDAVVVAAWAPVLKYRAIHWNVLEDPTWLAEDFRRWRGLLRCNDDDERGMSIRRIKARTSLTATPYEVMMNTVWLPKVRSAINGPWNIREPEPIVQLLETWAPPLLPRFIHENVIQQLVLPKLSRAVSDWDPRNDPVMVHTWIHPWLHVLGYWRMNDLFTEIRHKFSVTLRHWHPSDESALHILMPWKDVFVTADLDKLLHKSVVPKLAQVLHHEFTVNPQQQQLEPLVWCLAWQTLLPGEIDSLLEKEFFPKWLHVLQQWLSLGRDEVNYDEIRQWYTWWRQVFDAQGLGEHKAVAAGFRQGLDTIAKYI